MDVVWNKKSRGTGDGCVTVLWISSFGKWWSFTAPLTTVITNSGCFFTYAQLWEAGGYVMHWRVKKKKVSLTQLPPKSRTASPGFLLIFDPINLEIRGEGGLQDQKDHTGVVARINIKNVLQPVPLKGPVCKI